jgi:outer membrane murein-binding lipoprotein Lpp
VRLTPLESQWRGLKMKRITIVILMGLIVGVLLFASCGVPKSELEERDTQIAQLQAEKNQLETEKTQLETEKADLEEEKATLETQVADLTAQLAKCPQLEDPTYEEAVAFLREDKTDKEIPSDYAFAAMITAENAAKQGIRCYWVIAQLQAGYGYNFIGFNTTDKGWVYFLSTAELYEIKLVVDEHYYSINNLQTPGFNDTIVSLHYLPIP